jgi:hypothetical protein
MNLTHPPRSAAVVTVFKNHDLLGWYSTGAECKPADIQIHNQVPAHDVLQPLCDEID